MERKNQDSLYRTKVNSESYKNLLEIGLLPDCRRLYPNGDWIFQQDGAPAHTSKTTQEYLDGATPDFIRKDEWPPQSPDCNPMDYAVWDSLSQKVYAGKQDKFTENELKYRFESVGKTLPSEKYKRQYQFGKSACEHWWLKMVDISIILFEELQRSNDIA